MRVLFVDDEPRILEGLERVAFELDVEEIELSTVSSGRDALDRLAEEPFDILVSDMRMPGLDGAELLRRVHAEHPQVVRFVLSGQTDETQALRVAPFAHRLLSKPCPPAILLDALRSVQAMLNAVPEPETRRAIGRLHRLPVTPSLYGRLQALLADADVDVAELTAVVSADPSLAGKVLQVANSSLFRRGKSIADARTAVIRLGTRLLGQLVLTVEAFSMFPKIEHLDVDRLQRDAVRRSAIVRRLVEDDDAVGAALLCDIGLYVLASTAPARLAEIAAYAAEHGVSFAEAESALFRVTHADLGAYLTGLWGLPPAVVEAVACHHSLARLGPETSTGAIATWVADAIVSRSAVPTALLTERLGYHGPISDLERIGRIE